MVQPWTYSDDDGAAKYNAAHAEWVKSQKPLSRTGRGNLATPPETMVSDTHSENLQCLQRLFIYLRSSDTLAGGLGGGGRGLVDGEGGLKGLQMYVALL